MQGKTIDGIKLSTIVRVVSELDVISIREGAKHPAVLMADGLRPCPVAKSSDARRMISPWLRDATGYDARDIYSALRAGRWYQ